MDDRKTIQPIVPETLHDGVRVVAMSDVGCVREENQDFMGWFSVEAAQLLVVADGMGGHSGGFEASRIAVDKIRQTFVELGPTHSPVAVLGESVRRANAGVREVAASSSAMRGMGTTVVMALVHDGEAWLAHVGDSRCYLVRDGRATLLTMDHSRVNRMVAAGLLSPEAAEDHPMGHILERSVGADDRVEAEVTPKPLQLFRGDRLVLCSDGLWGMVKGHEIGDLFTGQDLRASVEAAIQLALDRGADDNTTVGSLEVVEGLAEDEVESPAGADETRRMPTASPTSQVPELQDGQQERPAAGAAATGIGFALLVGVLTVVALVLVVIGWRLLHTEETPPAPPDATGQQGAPEAAKPTPAPSGSSDTARQQAVPEPAKPAPTSAPTDAARQQPEPEASKPPPSTSPRDEVDGDKAKQGAAGSGRESAAGPAATPAPSTTPSGDPPG